MLPFLNVVISSIQSLDILDNVLRLLVSMSGYLIVIIEVHNVDHLVVCGIVAIMYIAGKRHGLELLLNYLVVVSSKFISECALDNATHAL